MSMKLKSKCIFKIAWTSCCIVATFSTMAWQLSNYYNGEEQQIVEYRMFNEMEADRYPSLSLCWTMTINDETLKRYGENFTSIDYANFLRGLVWNENMLMVNYDNVTPDLTDYVLTYGYWTSSDSRVSLYNKGSANKSKPGLKELSLSSQKCITIDIPFDKGHTLSGFYVYLNSSIFGNGGRLANPDVLFSVFSENQFHLNIHYPNQFFRRAKISKKHWPFRGEGSSRNYIMRLTVESTDVLVRRNTHLTPCIEGVPEHDQNILKYVLEKVQCKPPYWNSTSNLDHCSQQKQYRQVIEAIREAFYIGNAKKFFTVENPCRSLERISYDGMDIEIRQTWIKRYPWMNESVGVVLNFKELTYKEIKSVRGMDIQALIGKCYFENFNYITGN